jgi:hypothetical protein
MRKREFRVCCVCGKSADAALMRDASPWRGVALNLELTLRAPGEKFLHHKCRAKIVGMIAYKTGLQNQEVQKRMREDSWSRG